MVDLNPYTHGDSSGGMVSGINENIRPQNTVDLAVNLDFDYEIGSAVSRLGTGLVGSQLVNDNNRVLGLHQHIDSADSSNNVLFGAINASGDATSVIFNVNNVGSGAVVTGLTASKKVRFLTFLGETLAINGADAERAWNGSSWITTGGAFDLGDYPGSNSCDLAEEFLDRVYTAGDSSNPARLHFSSTPVGGAIAWEGDFVDIEPEDNAGPITALGKVPGYLLIFKERSIHRFDFYSTFPESLISIGTPSQESVVTGAGLCGFYSNSNENAKGFYITKGGQPQPISHDSTRPIKKFVDAISSANEADIAGWATEREFAWSVGDLTVDNVTYENVVLRYNHQLNQWSIRSYPRRFYVFANYLTSGVNTIVGGDDDGFVTQMDKPGTYTDYNGQKIHYILRKDTDFGTLKRKIISDRVVLKTENAQGAIASLFADGEKKSFTEVKKNNDEIQISSDVEANDISIQIEGDVNGGRAYIREILVPHLKGTNNYA